jgi:ABC-type uncharacterized transport system permease subunit
LRIAAILAACLFCILVLLALGASPLQAFGLIWQGSVGSFAKLDDVLTAWVPVLL